MIDSGGASSARSGPGPLGHAIEVASLSGLDYVQHVVALLTAVTDPESSPTELVVFSAGQG